MTVNNVAELLDGKILAGECNLSEEVHSACGADMMSDVLAFVKDKAVLFTGLMNPQVIRTAEMMDIICIVFVRGKLPGEDVIELANERGVTLIATKLRMFEACGKLYAEFNSAK
ncbi:MAG: hypothetical protein LBN42_00540 [Oscillospiraceae bacterium]|nr:hypothetical protein [Oscillospiraceae bacterium]